MTPIRIATRTVSIGIVLAAITFVGFRVIRVNATTAGFMYLLAILTVATAWGLAESVGASVAALFLFNYFFLPPIGTLTIADPQNWVALLTFLITSITASHLSSKAKLRAREAQERQRELERLYALSRSLLLVESPSVPGELARQIAQIFGATSVTVFDKANNSFHLAWSGEVDGLDEKLREAALRGTLFHDPAANFVVAAVRLGGQPIGSLCLKGVALSDSALQSIANLVAIGLERAHAQELANRAEAARQSDELKGTLLDAIAHEFKTPLTSIKAAASGLLASSNDFPGAHRELLTIVDEEADRLDGLVTEAIQMARLEDGAVRLERAACSLREITMSLLGAMRSVLRDRTVDVNIEPGVYVVADCEMLELALRQLLDNAVKYSPPGAPILVGAQIETKSVVVSVADSGPGVRPEERERIFEKFYRGLALRKQIPGAGLGLAIAREIVQVHGGEISVEENPGGGAVFRFTLPRAAEGDA